MAPNDPSVPAHAEMARVAQDVGAPAHATREVQDQGHAYLHHGRGGGGNLVKVEGAGDAAGGQGGRGERTRVIEGENGDWEEEGTGAPVEPAVGNVVHRGSMDKSRGAAREGQSEKPRQASARGPGAGYTAASEERLKVSSRAPGTAEVVSGTVQTRGRSVAEGANVEGEKARSGSRGIIGAGRGMLNRLRSPSGKKN